MKSTDAVVPAGNTDFGFDNLDPANIQSADVINVVIVADTSTSVDRYAAEFSKAYNDMKNDLKTSHVSNQLFWSVAEFNDDITNQTGFQPIASVPDRNFQCGGSTALYRTTLTCLKNALNYRRVLEDSAINCKTLIFVITDGDDMENASGKRAAAEVKKLVQELNQEERNFGSFTSILCGVGDNPKMFENAKNEMGFEHLVVVGDTPDQIRKMIGFISMSISSTASGQGISTANF